MRDLSSLGLDSQLRSTDGIVSSQVNIEEPNVLLASTVDNPPGKAIGSRPNSAVYDPMGIISSTNFTFGGTYSNASGTTTSSTLVPVPNGTVTLVLNRPQQVLLIATASGRETSNQITPDGLIVVIDVNGTNYLPGLFVDSPTGGGGNGGASTHTIVSLAAGTNTFTLEYTYASGGANGTAIIEDRRLTYLVLGN